MRRTFSWGGRKEGLVVNFGFFGWLGWLGRRFGAIVGYVNGRKLCTFIWSLKWAYLGIQMFTA